MDAAGADLANADLPAVAAVFANRARAAILDHLLDGEAHPAGELARSAGVAPSTASGHLAALLEAGLVVAQTSGRQRRFRLSRPEVARAMEALALIAPRRRVSSLRAATELDRLRRGRTCYDHLAGRLGVDLTEGLVARRALRPLDGDFALSVRGERLLEGVGADVDGARRRRRAFAAACPDWTERRAHLAGALGAVMCDRLFELRWVRRGVGRAVSVTEAGSVGLREALGVELPVW
jgi:DNA-binding transcriptional ArsR family regulator